MFAVPAIAQTEATASAATAADRVERMTTPMLTEQKLLMLGERLALGAWRLALGAWRATVDHKDRNHSLAWRVCPPRGHGK